MGLVDWRRDRERAAPTLTLVNDTFSGNVRGSIQTDQGATTIVANTIIGAGFSDGSDFACLASGRWTDARSPTGSRRRDHQRRRQQLRRGRTLRLRRQRRHRRRRPAPRLDRRQRRPDPHAGAARRQPGDRQRQPVPLPGKRPARHPPRRPLRHRRVPDAPDVGPRDPDHQRGRPHHRLERRPSRHDQPLGRRRWIPLRLGSVAGRPAQLDTRPGRRHRRQRHVRDTDALGPESRDHLLLQDRRRQLVRLHARHRVGHQELHDAGRRRRRCSTSMQTRSPTRPPTSRSRSTRTAPTPATSSSTATQIRATIRPPIRSTSVPTQATSSSRPRCRTSIPTATTTSR